MLSNLLEQNKRWAEAKVADDPKFFKRLSELQRPNYLWIGCSDSRVPANVITGLEPGEVFVHRNIANLVHKSDINLLSVLKYAVHVIEVKHIIVCGHYDCGGVKAAIEGKNHDIIDHWLQPIRDVADAKANELAQEADAKVRLDRLCEFSVQAQVECLSKMPVIKSAWENGKSLEIHGWAYGLSDGLLRDLNCGYKGC